MLISFVFGATYLLKVDHKAEVHGVSKQSVLSSQKRVMSTLKKVIPIQQTGAITKIVNVIRVEIDEKHVPTVKEATGVKQLIKSVTYALPKVFRSEVTAAKEPINGDALTGAAIVREEYNVSGESITVGIIDTGIDYTHSAFLNKDGSSRVVHCYDFTGQNDADDCMDTAGNHGTHVSGIVGGSNDKLTGVSPNCKLAGYKVFKKDAGAEDFHILQAMQQAANDKVDLINMSLGSASGFDHGILEEATEALYQLGILTIAANGNDGDQGLYMSGAPAIASNTIAVASVDKSNPSFFSSWGWGAELEIKPEVAAPGRNIYSSIPKSECKNKDCYDVYSGTSMASPYIAGVAALYKSHFKTLNGFKEKIMMTSKPLKGKSVYSVAQQGSGLVQLVDLFKNELLVFPSKLTMGATESSSYTSSQSIVVSNPTGQSLVFTTEHVPAQSAFEKTQFDSTTQVDMPQSVTVAPYSNATVTVSINPIGLKEGSLFSGYIQLISSISKISVPYGGFFGNYQSINPLEQGGVLPLPAFMTKDGFVTDDFTTAFSLEPQDIPFVLVRLSHPAAMLTVDLLDLEGNTVGTVMSLERLPRNYDFDVQNPGMYFHSLPMVTALESGNYCIGCIATDAELENWKEIQDGEYKLKITVLKALGDVHNKEHYVEWTSTAVMTVKRRRSKLVQQHIPQQLEMMKEQIYKDLKGKRVDSGEF